MGEELLGVRSCGVWTSQNAHEAGLSRHDIAARVRTGEWQRLHRGVFCSGGIAPDPVQRAWASVLASREGTAAGRTAARVHGLPLLDCADLDDVIAPGRSRPGLVAHRWRLEPSDVVRIAGCPVTSAARTLRDLRRVMSSAALVCAADDALHRRLVRLDEVPPALQGMVDDRAESVLETLTRLLLLPVLPTLEPQVVVWDERGVLVARLDLADRARRLGVEADGRTWHGSWEAHQRDQRRDAELRRLGWEILRVTWPDVRSRPERTIARVVAAAERRREAA